MDNQKTMNAQRSLQHVTVSDVGYDNAETVSSRAVAQWVRALFQNWRQGTLGAKGRSDVSLSGKKPWKQKGTGRARAGTASSPIWRGGGVVFGPQKRTRELAINKRLKRKVLQHVAQQFLLNEKVYLLDWQIEGDKPKTSQAAQALKHAGLHDKKLVLFVEQDDFLTFASFSNLPQVKLLLFDQANAFDIMSAQGWLVLNKDFGSFKEMVSRWI